MSEGYIDDSFTWGYTCDSCGETTEHITPGGDWIETGVPTPSKKFDGYIGHFCSDECAPDRLG